MKLRRLRWFWPGVLAAAATAFIALADLLVLPWHARGYGQAVTSWVNGAARLVELPGMLVAEKLGLRFGHRTGWAAWVVIVVVTALVAFMAGVILRRLWVGRRVTPVPAADGNPAEPNAASAPAATPMTSRRAFLRIGGGAVVAGAAAVGGYAFIVERRQIEVTRRSVTIRGLPRSLDGFSIAQLTDIHHGPWTSAESVRDVVRTTNTLGVDLIALTGDYVHYSPDYIPPVMAALAGLRGRVGVVATLGNHDWWEDGWMTLRELRRAGIPIVDNGRLFVSPDRRLVNRLSRQETTGLCVAGVGDLWEGAPDYDAALGGVPADMPRLLLSHNPDVAEESKFFRGGHRVDLMLSGHTHGGQIRVPGLGTPMIPSRYGQKYASGLVQGPACPVYVCRGIGTTIMPLRLGVTPEIAVIELRAG